MHLPFSHLLLFMFLSLPLAFAGCTTECGKVHIPYPFGFGSNCAMDPSFAVVCNKSTHLPKPYLNIINYNKLLEIIEINPTHIRVKYPYLLAATCYSNTSVFPHNVTRDDYYYIDLTDTPYAISDQNWLTAVGCDDIVVGFGNSKNFAGGCVSFCDSRDLNGHGLCPNDENGYSSGNGCCRTPIPKGTTYLAAQLSDLGGKWVRDKFYPCSYAFVEEKRISNQSSFSYPFSDLNYSTISKDDKWAFTRSSPPVVRLDWRVGTENCTVARRNSSTFACKSNTFCVDFDDKTDLTTQGYHCRCLPGYQGNPYQNNGCRDIDECAHSALNPCDENANCNNTIGSVKCLCRKGYFGDGRKNSKGCVPSNMINVFIGVGSGMGFILLFSICVLAHILLQKRRKELRKQKFFKRNGGLLLKQQTYEGTTQKTKLFSAEELEKATDNFNESRVIGQGGQGRVYKGMLFDGKIVAIKKSKVVDKDQLEQFINEVVILSQINHKNVVKLWGCCLETDVPLLVYELVPNGTLFDLIHDPTSNIQLSWNMRLKIASDLAGALAYLHSALTIPIYHRDVKSNNILLDEKYTVKISDFGISRSIATDRTHLTTLVKGTFGYFDPEYFQSNQFTEKSDVYSFGVVLVELLTGQRPISIDVNEEEKSLAMRFLACMEENNTNSILDPQVLMHGDEQDVIAVEWLAQRCLNWKGRMRPTMKKVATELESLMMYEEARVCEEAKSMKISETEYTWTASGVSEKSISISCEDV